MKNNNFKFVQEVEDLDVAESRKVLIPSTSGDNFVEAKDYQAIWNLSQNSLACISSKGYNIIQHREVVTSLFQAIENLNIPYEKKIKTQGHRIFVDITFPDTKILVKAKGLVKGEEFVGGIRLVNSFDKTTGLLILPRMERVVCANGMIVSQFITGYSIRHNQALVKDFQIVIEKAINGLVNSSSVLQAILNECIADSIEWQYCELVLKNLIKYKKHTEGILEILKQNKKDVLTRWDIYNSVTAYCSHNAQLKPSIEAHLQNKAQHLLKTKLEVLSVDEEDAEAPQIEVLN
jgi:hypothetical protein